MAAPIVQLPAVSSLEELDFSKRHEIYEERVAVWKYNDDHFGGGRVLVEENQDSQASGDLPYLHRSMLESDEGYNTRLKRAASWYFNLPKSGLLAYSGQVYRISPRRDIPEQMELMVSDVDLEGTDADPFFQNVFDYTQRHGLSFVLVDSPMFSDSLSEAEAVSRRLRPYFEHIPASHVKDWDVEREDPARRGQLNYVVIQDEIAEAEGPLRPSKYYVRYRVWTPSNWITYMDERTSGGSASGKPFIHSFGPNIVGEVPLVQFYDRRVRPMVGETVFDDVCLAANGLWNAASGRDEAYQFQSFNQLVLATDTKLAELNLGRSRAIKLPTGGSAQYLTPSSIPFEAFEKIATETVERIADLVFARTSRQSPTGQVESAEKRDLDRQEFIALLERKASNMQEGEQRCWEFAARFYRITAEDAHEEVTIEYNREFRVNERTVDDWIKLVKEAIFSRVEMYQAYHPGTTEDEAEEALAENRKAREEEVASMFEGSGTSPFGAPGNPPPNTNGSGAGTQDAALQGDEDEDLTAD